MDQWQSAVWIWLCGIAFALTHSLLASRPCKQWACARGLQEPRYRLCYSLLGLLTTLAWAGLVHALPDAPLYDTDGAVRWALIALQLTGAAVALAAFQPIDGLAFLGLRAAPENCDPFIERGIYRYLRHPMYTGAMLILLAMPAQSWNGLHFTLAICLYFVIGARFEEGRMRAAHPEYAGYRRRVPAFVPRLW